MLDRTRELWNTQHRSVGERTPLFASVADTVDATSVLYPGSYVDLTPSFIWPSVTYVDSDRRAKRFFDDAPGIDELLTEHGADPNLHTVRFIGADYREHPNLADATFDLADATFDLMVSLYAGFVSEHCTRYLRVGGSLLVNSSHGDAALASIDPRCRLRAVVTLRNDIAHVSTTDLGSYLVPKREVDLTRELLHRTGRGISYTKSPFAYIFERVE